MVVWTAVALAVSGVLALGVTLSFIIEPLAILLGVGAAVYLVQLDQWTRVDLFPREWQDTVLQAGLSGLTGYLVYRMAAALIFGGFSLAVILGLAAVVFFGPNIVFMLLGLTE